MLSYEDGDEKWHKVDLLPADISSISVAPNFEGTLDEKSTKYRVVAVAMAGEGSVLKFGDDSDHHVEDGVQFPPIPPVLSESRLPQLIHNTQVSETCGASLFSKPLHCSHVVVFAFRYTVMCPLDRP